MEPQAGTRSSFWASLSPGFFTGFPFLAVSSAIIVATFLFALPAAWSVKEFPRGLRLPAEMLEGMATIQATGCSPYPWCLISTPQTAPVQEVPVQEVPVQDAPVQDAPLQDAPSIRRSLFSSDTEVAARLCEQMAIRDCDDPLKRNALQFIYDTQNPEECRTSGFVVIHRMHTGFAGQLGYWAMHRFMAARMHRVLLVTGNWSFTKGCSAQSPNCFFRAPSKCSMDDINLDQATLVRGGPGDHTPLPRGAVFPSFRSRLMAKTSSEPKSKVLEFPRVLHLRSWRTDWFFQHKVIRSQYVPDEFRERDPTWFASLFYLYEFRLLPDLLQEAQAIKEQMKWEEAESDKGVIGLHIRHGDKIKEVKKLFSVDDYFEEVANITAKTGAKTVYLSTDDPRVIQAITEDPKYSQWNIVIRNDTGRYGDSVASAVNVAYWREDGYQLGVDAAINIWLMSEANYFVGTLMSNFGRYALHLMYAKGIMWGPPSLLDISRGEVQEENHPDAMAFSQVPWKKMSP